MTQRIYLDNNATTEMDPRVVEAMVAELSAPPSNPSSVHAFGRDAKNRLRKARQSVAEALSVKAGEIIFTSGGTESMNFLIRGFVAPDAAPHIVTSDIEHACVEKTLSDLQKQGCRVTFLPTDATGMISPQSIEDAVTSDTKLLVFSAVNGETGVKHDLAAAADLALRKQIPLIVDAVASFGKEPLDIFPGITAMGFSGHKIHGPKGVGFVFLRSGSKTGCRPLVTGGGQEYGLRSGTENLPGIIGLAKAVEVLREELPIATTEMRTLRDLLEKKLKENIPSVQINGFGERVCNVSNLLFPGVDAETLLMQLDLSGVAASQGSACSSGALEPSRVLMKMGLSPSSAKSSVRFSLGRFNTKKEIETVIELLTNLIPRLTS